MARKRSSAKRSSKAAKKPAKKAVRKTAGKTAAKAARKPSEKRELLENPVVFLSLLAGLIAVFALLAYLFSSSADGAVEPTVLATVNGEEISNRQFQFQYQLLPPSYKQQLSEQEVLEQMINEQLVVQEARAAGHEVSDEELNERVQEILQQGGLSPSDLQKNLDFFNITMDEFESLVRRQLLIQKYTDEVIDVPEPTEDELRNLYAVRQEELTEPAKVTVRHILISGQRDNAAELSRSLYERARSGEDFCMLVQNYTDDKGSIETCGEYTFPRNFMVPAFENASFSMRPDSYRMIQTEFGYHIIWKVEDHPSSVKEFEEVRGELAQTLASAERSRQYRVIISDLRDDAEITYADGWEGAYEPPAPEENADGQLLECIASEAVLYGTSWSTDTQDALEMFSGVQLEYVNCEEEACEGIEAYPTWVIDGEQYLGRMSLEELSLAAGCE